MSKKEDLVHANLPAANYRHGDGRNQKRKVHRAERAISKATSKRDLPTGVRKNTSSGNYYSSIWRGGKSCYIGSFNTPEQASAAYESVLEELARVKVSTLSADEVNAVFDAAKEKAAAAVGGVVPKKYKTKCKSVSKTA